MSSEQRKINEPRKYAPGWEMGFWRRFLDTHPEYLARHYWWAYLWRWGVWFFDHQPVINAILFGQYQILYQRALRACTANRPEGRLLQLTCVYGHLTPSLLRDMDDELYLMDVAEIQLATARHKLTDADKQRLLAARMNAEYLAYRDNAFATILLFFLLHELPFAARELALSEVMRVLRPGGRLVITEYGPCPRKKHLLWRLWPVRTLLLRLEPFLDDFWRQDLAAILSSHAQKHDKRLRQVDEFRCLAGFYRVCVFELDGAAL